MSKLKEKKIALITGASSGIGMATAKLLAAHQYSLIIVARRITNLNRLAEKLKQQYTTDVFCLQLDVTDKKAVFSAIEELPLEWQNIDVLINNAGLASGLNTIDNGDTNDWDAMIDTNLKGLLYTTRAVVDLMKKQQNGHIVNIGSIAGKEVYANGNVYCATKHAVDALNKAMRMEFVTHGIKVTAINPGAVETEFSVVRFKGDKTRAAKVYEGFENLVAEDIADAIYYVLSRPKHVNINDLTIMPTAQPAAGVIHRKA